MKIATHEFEGEHLTIRQIAERVPVLSERTIRRHLSEGRRTRVAMLSVDPADGRARGGRALRRLKAGICDR